MKKFSNLGIREFIGLSFLNDGHVNSKKSQSDINGE